MNEVPTPSTNSIRYRLSDAGLEVEFRTLIKSAWPSGGGHAYGRIPQDVGPQASAVVLRGLPEGTTCISVWMCEWQEDCPQAVGARVNTSSALLYARGTRARVQFHKLWEEPTPAAIHVLYCQSTPKTPEWGRSISGRLLTPAEMGENLV